MDKIFLGNIKENESRGHLNNFKTITYEDGATDIYEKKLSGFKQILYLKKSIQNTINLYGINLEKYRGDKMRESIGKYRGKSVNTGEWVYGCLVKDTVSAYLRRIDYGIQQPNCYAEEVDPETVGEFTGEALENQDVYEGDLIEWEDIKGRKKTLEVMFRDGSFVATDGNPSYALSIVTNITMHTAHGKLVGNIHEKEKA